MPPDEPTDEERQEELPEDNGTPFGPADVGNGDPATFDTQDRVEQAAALDDTHPVTDSNVEQPEIYDAGIASIASEPNAGNAVVEYNPPTDSASAASGDAAADDSEE